MHAVLTLWLQRCCHFALDVPESTLLQVRWFVRSFIRSFVPSLVRSFVRSLVRSLVRPWVRSLVGRAPDMDPCRVQNLPSANRKSGLGESKIEARSPR